MVKWWDYPEDAAPLHEGRLDLDDINRFHLLCAVAQSIDFEGCPRKAYHINNTVVAPPITKRGILYDE